MGLSSIGPVVHSSTSAPAGSTSSRRLRRSGGVRRGGNSGRGPAGNSGSSRRGASRFQWTPGGSPNPHKPTPTRVTPVASYRIAHPVHKAANASARTRAVRRRASIAMGQPEAKEWRRRDTNRTILASRRNSNGIKERGRAAICVAGAKRGERALAENSRSQPPNPAVAPIPRPSDLVRGVL